MKPGIYDNISNHQYHRAKKYRGLSSSGIKNILVTPAHYMAALENDKQTPAKLFGSAAHSIILQPELKEVAVIPPLINRRTNDGKAEYAEWEKNNAGKIIIKDEDYQKILDMRDAVRQHNYARQLLANTRRDLSVFWKHPEYGFTCKCRPDAAHDLDIIVDYKTCEDASMRGFAKAAVKHGYDISAEWYQRGMKAVTGKKFDFVLIAQEKQFPYAVAVYNITEDIFQRGREHNDRACKIYHECRESGEWPAYPDRIFDLELPGWAYK